MTPLLAIVKTKSTCQGLKDQHEVRARQVQSEFQEVDGRDGAVVGEVSWVLESASNVRHTHTHTAISYPRSQGFAV